jgi:hypothetical protein
MPITYLDEPTNRPSMSVEERQKIVAERAKQLEAADLIKEENDKVAAENIRSLERRKKFQVAGATGSPLLQATAVVEEFSPEATQMIQSAGIVGGSTALGQVAGQRLYGPVGRSVGGAMAAAIGEIIDQGLQKSANPNFEFRPGQVAAAAFQGLLPTQGAKRNAIVNASAEVIRSIVDEQKFPELKQLSTAAATGYVAGKLSQQISGQKLTPHDALYVYRNDAFRALRGEGFVVNPMELRRGGDLIPRLAGASEGLGSEAIQRNQFNIQKLARQDLGLSKEAVGFRPTRIDKRTGKVIRGEIDEVIYKAEQSYRDLRGIADTAKKELDDFNSGKSKSWRYAMKSPEEVDAILKANDNLDALKRTREEVKDAALAMKAGEEGALARFKAAKDLEDSIEAKIDLAASAAGNPKLLERLKSDRVTLSKAFAVRDSVNATTGILDIQALESIRATPSRPGRMLTGWLAKLADFATAFSRNAQDAVNAPIPGSTGGALNYTVRQTAERKPSGPLAAGVPYLSKGAQNLLLSETMQNRFAQPQYIYNADSIPSAASRNTLMNLGRGTPAEQGQQKAP